MPSIRESVGRSAPARSVYRRAKRLSGWAADRALSGLSFWSLPDRVAIRLGYEVLLQREPDPEGLQDYSDRLRAGMSRPAMIRSILASDEMRALSYPPELLTASIHNGRGQFIRSLPRARRIIDLGGSHPAQGGAMVTMGYPYAFDELTIVDLPVEERHALYRTSSRPDRVATHLGPVTYRYHSMVDLSGIAEASVDLVYSGQSIEHVTTSEGRTVASEVVRVLSSGGWFALDTPNSRVTRLQQAGLIDPDHAHEYGLDELAELVVGAGLEIVSTAGLNYCGRGVERGEFDLAEAAHNSGVFAASEDCYILCLVCRKP